MKKSRRKGARTLTGTTVKPAGSQWTDDQWQAIVEKGDNILVAAAAGSGKTAVLVERIIKRITDPKDPVDIDRLLVVTFTNAAAAEMRVRIGQALERELNKDPGNLRLRDQLTLLNKANITTFHAFCMAVVRRYYYQLDIDPAFRVIDDAESLLLREEVLEGLLEDHYQADDKESFYNLVDRYSNDRSDTQLMALVQKIYDFSRSHPWPDHWLDQVKAFYQTEGITSVDELPWTADVKKSVREECRGLLSMVDNGEQIANEPGGPYPYIDNFAQDRELILQIIDASRGPWEELYHVFSALSFSKLKPCKGDDFDEELKQRASDIRKKVKDRLNKLKEELFSQTPERILADLEDMAPYVESLIQLVKEFGDRFSAVKKEKGLADFSDLEHGALAILRAQGSSPEKEMPSAVALQYRAQFEEILVDEYQDTNLVQETILNHVARGQNVFMVGDVKQSIYRFRLAEPGLFQAKYKTYGKKDGAVHSGIRIDLSQNFRSRKEILDGTNFIFQQVMDEEVGEIDYDEDAKLKFGASYYPEGEYPAELHVLVKEDQDDERDPAIDVDEYQTAELEGHFIANQIKNLIQKPYQVWDKSSGRMRPIQYRDIVILLRSASSWAPAIMDVLKQHGIPSYAESTSGYFHAVEVSVMLSLLSTIDNPYQDIPLAAVLRSPLVGLSASELARIRVAKKSGPYYEAMRYYCETYRDDLSEKLSVFTDQLEAWRDRARRGALSDLIWQIYRETGYYDYVAGLTGGEQRKANLRALYDRARQYEQTSFRGLFRFLRFIDRLRENQKDLGEARALSEQEDVVRVMTIHKSKGLEFPVVFVPALNKAFNREDVKAKALLHKTLGFATKNIDPIKRLETPTLPHAAVKRKLIKESTAEEMRILYVALTRAREKLILVGTIKEKEKTLEKWASAEDGRWLLPAYLRENAQSYLDWVGPSLLRHRSADEFHQIAEPNTRFRPVWEHPSNWRIALHPANRFVTVPTVNAVNREREENVRRSLPVEVDEKIEREVAKQLSWTYPHQEATQRMVKQTVTEIKRQQERFSEGFDDRLIKTFRRPIGDRPKFLSERELTAAEKGTAMHRMMQLLDFRQPMTIDDLHKECERLVEAELMTYEEAESLDLQAILTFFESEIGKRLLHAKRIVRELPFSLALSTSDIYGHKVGGDEKVLVQGVIDCLYESEDGLRLLDYKTDAIQGRFSSVAEAKKAVIQRYRKQLEMYRLAIEKIWHREIKEMGLYLFDGGYYFPLED